MLLAALVCVKLNLPAVMAVLRLRVRANSRLELGGGIRTCVRVCKGRHVYGVICVCVLCVEVCECVRTVKMGRRVLHLHGSSHAWRETRGGG